MATSGLHPKALPDISEQAGVLNKATLRAAKFLNISDKTLARIIGVSASSISRLKTGGFSLSNDSKAFELAILFVRLFRGLDAITGGDDKSSQSWLNSYNTVLREKPINAIQTAYGLVSAIDYVDSRRATL